MLNLPCHMQMTIVMTSDIEALFASGPLCQAGFINIRLNRISAPACNESGLDPVGAFQQPGQNHQPMKVLIYSDLHIEFKPFDPPDVEADLVVLAGDISIQKRGVLWANETFTTPVVYCVGNHERYKGHLDRTVEKMKSVAAAHVHVMENESLILGNVRFLVATGWTDFGSTGDWVAASKTCAREMNDFRMIRADSNYRRLRPHDLMAKNEATRAFLDRELSNQFNGKTFVITHHCPIPEVAGDEHDGHISAAYFNRWHALVEQVDYWMFGHTHHSVDTVLSGCRLLSNQRGYPGEDCGFDPTKLIEIL